jgi:hypothetical protein
VVITSSQRQWSPAIVKAMEEDEEFEAQVKEVKEFKNDINLCLIQIKRMKRNLAELEWLEQFLESFLDEEHYDERIPPIIKDIEILLKEITTLGLKGYLRFEVS